MNNLLNKSQGTYPMAYFYSTYLIFAKDRLTADDSKLTERIRSTGKKFFFIRAQIDQDVENARKSRMPY